MVLIVDWFVFSGVLYVVIDYFGYVEYIVVVGDVEFWLVCVDFDIELLLILVV